MECRYPSICTICNGSLEPDRAILESHIIEVVRATFGVDPKPKQVEVLYKLAFERVDTILIAKTGFGKSLIFHALPAIVGHDGIALMIMPLLELEADQARKLTSLDGCRPFVLNADTDTRENRRNIGAGKYTHGTSIRTAQSPRGFA